MRVPRTVKIKNGVGGFFILNQSDFDPLKHELYVEGEAVVRVVNEELTVEDPEPRRRRRQREE
jgi:hypothetical protein